MLTLKQRKIALYFFALLICYAVTGCHKNINSEQLGDGSSKALNSVNGIGGYDLRNGADKVTPFDYDHDGKLDDLVLYRPGSRIIWVVKNNAGNFSPVFQSSNGIAGFTLEQAGDKVYAFDYDHSGMADHLLIYRPGSKIIKILKNIGGNFTPVFESTNGIGGFNLDQPQDLIFTYDYEHSGKLDYLVVYRPGSKAIWILKNESGNFIPVYQGSNGIGGFNLDQPQDKIFAFDYDHSGKLDHLAIYRSKSKAFWIIKNDGGVFSPVFQSSNGIGGYNLDQLEDLAFPYDYDHSGKLDYIALYRHGSRAFWIVQNNGGVFTPVYQGSNGIGGYDLAKTSDVVLSYDYESSGKADHFILYRPGEGIIWIVKNTGGIFSQVF